VFGCGRSEVAGRVFVTFFLGRILLVLGTFTCQIWTCLHPHIFHCGSCLVCFCFPSPILPSSVLSSSAAGRPPHGSAILSSQLRMAGPAAHSYNSIAPDPAAFLRVPQRLETSLESTSHSPGRSRYRVPGCPSLFLTCGDRTAAQKSGYWGHRAAVQ
jgi:hypothetical protein